MRRRNRAGSEIEMEAIDIVQSVGFPVAVTCWFMFRTEKIMTQNTEAIRSLENCLVGLKK